MSKVSEEIEEGDWPVIFKIMILGQEQSEITKLVRILLMEMCIIEMLIFLLIWVGEKVTQNLFSIP